MRHGRGEWILVGLCLAMAALPVRGAGGPVTLSLDNVTAAEAVEALGKAAGVPVQLAPGNRGEGGKAPGGQDRAERASFSWAGLSFGKALRQVCQKYGLMPNRASGAYVLYPFFGAPPGPAGRRVGLVEKEGAHLFLRSLSVSSSRGLRFVGGPENFDYTSMALEVGCELDVLDADTIAGLDNVVARDNLGNLLTAEQQFLQRGYWGGQFPDEWVGSVNLSAPHPRARSLQWIEGDLLAYKSLRQLRVEVPLPLPDQGARRQAEEVTVEVVRFGPPPKNGDGADAPAGPNSFWLLQARLHVPPGSRLASPGGYWTCTPMMLDAAGKAYAGGAATGGEEGGVQEMTSYIQAGQEKPARLVFNLVGKARPEKLFSFRMQDVPLPPESIPLPRRAAPPPVPRGPAPDPERPFYEKGGGTLAGAVEIQGKPAGEGTLSLGLSTKSGGDWSAVRWVEVPVEKEGAARLEDVKPGTYRILRAYRPREPVKGLADGRWLNGEVTVEVMAGKEAPLPPLRWLPEPEETKPAPRPAAKMPRRLPRQGR